RIGVKEGVFTNLEGTGGLDTRHPGGAREHTRGGRDMAEMNYWTRSSLGRRAALRGAGVGIAGLAGAALLGCGGGDEDPATPAAGGGGATGTAAAGGGDGKVPADQVRVAPGRYEGQPPPTPAE